MATRSQFYRLALEANERQTKLRDVDELPVPTLDERVNLYLRAVHGNRDFTEEERWHARNILLNSMAAEIATRVVPVEEHVASAAMDPDARYSRREDQAQEQDWAREPEVVRPRPPHPNEIATPFRSRVRRKKAIIVAPTARGRMSLLALTATLGLVLIVTGGTLGYRWTYHPHVPDEVIGLEPRAGDEARVPPPAVSSRSGRPHRVAAEAHVVIESRRSEADVLAAFRVKQAEFPKLLGQATLKRVELVLPSYTAQLGPFASEKDAAAACLALEAADIRCTGPWKAPTSSN